LLATSATITVSAPAATITLDTTTASTGGIVIATVANGPAQVKDWIGLYATGASTLLATSAAITVNSGAALSFVASPTTTVAAGVVTATVSNGPGATRDWIGVYNASGTLLDWKYLNGTQTAPATPLTAASVPFTMPTTLGTYTLRFY